MKYYIIWCVYTCIYSCLIIRLLFIVIMLLCIHEKLYTLYIYITVNKTTKCTKNIVIMLTSAISHLNNTGLTIMYRYYLINKKTVTSDRVYKGYDKLLISNVNDNAVGYLKSDCYIVCYLNICQNSNEFVDTVTILKKICLWCACIFFLYFFSISDTHEIFPNLRRKFKFFCPLHKYLDHLFIICHFLHCPPSAADMFLEILIWIFIKNWYSITLYNPAIQIHFLTNTKPLISK